MKIYDCFIFFNELELLELRLMTLYNHVDYFVLVEAGTTFTGKNKEYYFENNKEKFKNYLDKIIHIKIPKLPYENDAWGNEYFNRNAISQGLIESHDNDYIMISDVDEIPNPIVLKWGIERGFNFFILNQKLFYYYVNCLQKQVWSGPVVTKRKDMKTPQELRKMRGSRINPLDEGGWHYSFLGGEERIKAKLEAYAETQTNNNTTNNNAHIIKCLETGGDLFNRKEEMFIKTFLPLNQLTHQELIEWLKKYPNMIKL